MVSFSFSTPELDFGSHHASSSIFERQRPQAVLALQQCQVCYVDAQFHTVFELILANMTAPLNAGSQWVRLHALPQMLGLLLASPPQRVALRIQNSRAVLPISRTERARGMRYDYIFELSESLFFALIQHFLHAPVFSDFLAESICIKHPPTLTLSTRQLCTRAESLCLYTTIHFRRGALMLPSKLCPSPHYLARTKFGKMQLRAAGCRTLH
jgi:hypothetical protein